MKEGLLSEIMLMRTLPETLHMYTVESVSKRYKNTRIAN